MVENKTYKWSVKNRRISRAYKNLIFEKEGIKRIIDVGYDERLGRYREIIYNADKSRASFGKFVSSKLIEDYLGKIVHERNAKRYENLENDFLHYNNKFFQNISKYVKPLALVASLFLASGFSYVFSGCSRQDSKDKKVELNKRDYSIQRKSDNKEIFQLPLLTDYSVLNFIESNKEQDKIISNSDKKKDVQTNFNTNKTEVVKVEKENTEKKESLESLVLVEKSEISFEKKEIKPSFRISPTPLGFERNNYFSENKEIKNEDRRADLNIYDLEKKYRENYNSDSNNEILSYDHSKTEEIVKKIKIVPIKTQNFSPKNPSKIKSHNSYFEVKGKGMDVSDYIFDSSSSLYVLKDSPRGQAILRKQQGKKATKEELTRILQERSEKHSELREIQYLRGEFNPLNPIINYVDASKNKSSRNLDENFDEIKIKAENFGSSLLRIVTSSYFPKDHNTTKNDLDFKENLKSLEETINQYNDSLNFRNIPKEEDPFSKGVIYVTQLGWNAPIEISQKSLNLVSAGFLDNFLTPVESLLNNGLDLTKHIIDLPINSIKEDNLPPGINKFTKDLKNIFRSTTYFASRVLSDRPHRAMNNPIKAAEEAGSAAGRNFENISGFVLKFSLPNIKSKVKKGGEVIWDSEGSPGGNGFSFISEGSSGGM
ncbi:MAG: hypothetical protein QXG18_01090 [Candidatus Pacearchaeota archaeon]